MLSWKKIRGYDLLYRAEKRILKSKDGYVTGEWKLNVQLGWLTYWN